MADNRQTTMPSAAAGWPVLPPGETLQWEGRPMPRCYTFRQWRYALCGLVLTVLCLIWTWLRLQPAAVQEGAWLAWLPLPFLAFALWLAFGQLLAARLEWNNVAYAVTDRRVIVRRGLFKPQQEELDVARVTWFRLQFHGEELGTLRIRGELGDPELQMHCIDYPRRPADLLAAAIKAKEQGTRNKVEPCTLNLAP